MTSINERLTSFTYMHQAGSHAAHVLPRRTLRGSQSTPSSAYQLLPQPVAPARISTPAALPTASVVGAPAAGSTVLPRPADSSSEHNNATKLQSLLNLEPESPREALPAGKML